MYRQSVHYTESVFQAPSHPSPHLMEIDSEVVLKEMREAEKWLKLYESESFGDDWVREKIVSLARIAQLWQPT